jgi:metal-responsive CopG/Arc/MetJ family transcriptional regulator
MKHNISITVEQKLFREIENTRGREKRSTFIEHLIIQGLKAYREESAQQGSQMALPFAVASSVNLYKRKVG